ncbi:hypothetical protein TrVE_jg405 [Triparma verrucosa]|uniref:WW domain-containing protein n=1 Tax=Triparma verrucosa TaxID=1606542 RepID=A0A9W7F769_9STRA|nr:hypothetical protein TrVE_jg405 [Triparma verrucosa]
MHSAARRPDTHDLPKLDSSRAPTFPREAVVSSKSLEMMQCPVEETLFIYVTKNPYSWVNSMTSRSYNNAAPRRSTIRTVINSRWNNNYENYRGGILEMRYDKMKAALKLKDMPGVRHFQHVKYEDFLENARNSLTDLLQKFDIPQSKEYKGVYYATRGEKMTEKGLVKADHIGEKFKKFTHYVEGKYLDLYDVKLMDEVTGKMNVELESRVGYKVPPEGFHKSKEKLIKLPEGFFGKLSHFGFSLIWWIVFPLTIILACLTPVAVWLAHSSEAEEVVERGDGVTVEQEEERRRRLNEANNVGAGHGGVLQEGWFEAVDVDSGRPYYFHRATRQVTWEKPVVKAPQTNERYKKTDEFDEVAFNDALHAVSTEKARDRLPLNATREQKEQLTAEISADLRRRYIKNALKQQREAEAAGVGGVGGGEQQRPDSVNDDDWEYVKQQDMMMHGVS